MSCDIGIMKFPPAFVFYLNWIADRLKILLKVASRYLGFLIVLPLRTRFAKLGDIPPWCSDIPAKFMLIPVLPRFVVLTWIETQQCVSYPLHRWKSKSLNFESYAKNQFPVILRMLLKINTVTNLLSPPVQKKYLTCSSGVFFFSSIRSRISKDFSRQPYIFPLWTNYSSMLQLHPIDFLRTIFNQRH